MLIRPLNKVLAFALAILISASVFADDRLTKLKHIDPETGFRTERYRAPTPDFVPGGTVIDFIKMSELVSTGSALPIDVSAATGAGPDPLDGTWLLSKPRQNIEGSIWLPEVGRAYLEDYMKNYFETQLAQLTGGNKNYPVVFYCIADCWMSWNAVIRASKWGYDNLYWYPDGSDGWVENDMPVVDSIPVPVIVD